MSEKRPLALDNDVVINYSIFIDFVGTVYSMEWRLRSEFRSGVLELSGVRVWSGKSRMECSCDVCVTDPLYSNPKLRSKTPLHRIHNFWSQIFGVLKIVYSMEWSLETEFWSGVLEQSFGMECWSGVESNFGVAKVLALCS